MKTAATSLAASLLLTAGLLGGCKSNEPKPEAEAQPAPAASAPAAAAPVEKEAPARPVCPPEPPKTAKGKETKDSKSKTVKKDPNCVPAAPAPAAAPTTGDKGPYDLSKNKPVTDSTKVEAGQGTTVKGINEWQGEVSGLPAANSKFTKLRIGMPMKQVTDLVGEPTDQGAYITGKAFIPFYFGSDKSRWEMTYKGQGRLILSNQSGFGTGYYLTWIIHNANEPGYR